MEDDWSCSNSLIGWNPEEEEVGVISVGWIGGGSEGRLILSPGKRERASPTRFVLPFIYSIFKSPN